MLASAITDIAFLLLALAVFIVAVVLVVRRQFKSFDVKMGTMSATLTGIDAKVEQVNVAVNHVPHGSPTLVQRVTTAESRLESIEDHQKWERAALERIADHVGADLPGHAERDRRRTA